MEAIAKGKFLRGSPQKARLVIDLIRGKNVAHALAILQFTNKRATENIEKCLRSAIANATHKAEQDNVAVDPDDLWVKSCFVDMGPHKNRRRVRPAPQGRAYREQRHYCHITVLVTSEKPENAKDNRPKKAVFGVKKQRNIDNAKLAASAKETVAPPVEAEVVETEPNVLAEETMQQEATTAAPIETNDVANTENVVAPGDE